MAPDGYTLATIQEFVEHELGVSDWLAIDQERINEFAECTGDDQWIHVDVERARRESPYGSTIAHGYLILALLPQFLYSIGIVPDGVAQAINYGIGQVRFLAPVKPGARIRDRATLLAAEDKGDGRVLITTRNTVEIDGIGANLELLQPFVDALDGAITVIRFDAPGTGGSPAPRLPYRFPSLARLAAQMLDQLGYDRVDVLGISWGGGLAQQFAVQYPRRCRRLILVSTSTGALMVPARPDVLAKLVTPRRYFDQSYLESIGLDLYGGSIRSNPELVRELAQGMHGISRRGYFYQLLAGLGWTSVLWLRLVRQPTLILSGDDDPIIPLANAKILHALLPNARLHIFHGGHLGLVTEAHELAPVVAQFLAEDEQQAGMGRTPGCLRRMGRSIQHHLKSVLARLDKVLFRFL